MKFIVTGTGRCGTKYTAKYLQDLGLVGGHESIFSTSFDPNILGDPNHKYAKSDFEVSWMAVPHLRLLRKPVIHLVRDPVKVWQSMERIGLFTTDSHGNYRRAAEDVSGQHNAEDFIIWWQDEIEKSPWFRARWRVEDLWAPHISTRTNTRPAHDGFEERPIPQKIIRRAAEYGYYHSE